jgi:hypothetical protein
LSGEFGQDFPEVAEVEEVAVEVHDAEQILRQLEELVPFIRWIHQHAFL